MDLPRSRDWIVRNFQNEADAGLDPVRIPTAWLGSWASQYAQRIVDEPQAHMDSLLPAGVVEAFTFCATHRRVARDRHGDGECRFCGGEHVTAYLVREPRKPCPAWLEAGNGRQACEGLLGHDEGEHPSPHSAKVTATADGIITSYTLWLTGGKLER